MSAQPETPLDQVPIFNLLVIPPYTRLPGAATPDVGAATWNAAVDYAAGRRAFVILTTGASGQVAQIHDRMPVILPRERAQLWLENPDSGLLVPAPDDFLTATEVSRRVNDVHNDDPAVLGPPEPEKAAPDKPEQLGLL